MKFRRKRPQNMDDLSRPYTCIFQKFSMAFPSSFPTQKKGRRRRGLCTISSLGSKNPSYGLLAFITMANWWHSSIISSKERWHNNAMDSSQHRCVWKGSLFGKYLYYWIKLLPSQFLRDTRSETVYLFLYRSRDKYKEPWSQVVWLINSIQVNLMLLVDLYSYYGTCPRHQVHYQAFKFETL